MQLNEVVSSNYVLFENFGEDERKKQVESVNYLRFLCQVEEVPEASVNVP